MARPRIAAEQRRELREKITRCLGRGRKQALTGKHLAYMVESDPDGQDRYLRLLIRDLIDSGLPIASATAKPAGFFIAINREEAEQYCTDMVARIKEDAARLRAFKRAARHLFKPEQLHLIEED